LLLLALRDKNVSTLQNGAAFDPPFERSGGR